MVRIVVTEKVPFEQILDSSEGLSKAETTRKGVGATVRRDGTR